LKAGLLSGYRVLKEVSGLVFACSKRSMLEINRMLDERFYFLGNAMTTMRGLWQKGKFEETSW